MMRTVECVALTLVITGALNWALVGLFDFNLVTFIFGEGTVITGLIYFVIGLCGIISLTLYSKLDQ